MMSIMNTVRLITWIVLKAIILSKYANTRNMDNSVIPDTQEFIIENAAIFFSRSSSVFPHSEYLDREPTTTIMPKTKAASTRMLMLSIKNMMASVTKTIAEPNHNAYFMELNFIFITTMLVNYHFMLEIDNITLYLILTPQSPLKTIDFYTTSYN